MAKFKYIFCENSPQVHQLIFNTRHQRKSTEQRLAKNQYTRFHVN